MQRRLRGFRDVIVLPYGLWKTKGELCFEGKAMSTSKLTEGNGKKIVVDSIDHLCAQEKVTFIKMDIEGGEMDALIGAEQVIMRDRPKLAICIYHSPKDIYEISFWVKRIVPEYKLYIRHHSDTASETVLYASV